MIRAQAPEAPAQMVNLDLSLAKDLVCENCQCPYFERILRMKFFSAIVSPRGKDELAPVEVLLCKRCETEFNIESAIKNQIKDDGEDSPITEGKSIIDTE